MRIILWLFRFSVDNILTIKAILRSFKFAFILKVNFSKSCILRVNVGRKFLELAEDYLYYRYSELLFTYLGFPVRAKASKEETWDLLVKVVSARLASCKKRFVSLGGKGCCLIQSFTRSQFSFSLFWKCRWKFGKN